MQGTGRGPSLLVFSPVAIVPVRLSCYHATHASIFLQLRGQERQVAATSPEQQYLCLSPTATAATGTVTTIAGWLKGCMGIIPTDAGAAGVAAVTETSRIYSSCFYSCSYFIEGTWLASTAT